MYNIRFSGRHFYKMADTKVDKGQIQNILIQWNRLSSYLYFDHNITSLGRVGHIQLLVLAATIFKNGGC